MNYQREVVIPFEDRRGVVRARVRLLDRAQDSILALDKQEASLYGEEPIQLLESRAYDYAVVECASGLSLQETEVVQPNRLNWKLGRLEPGLATGLLTIRFVDPGLNTVAEASVEVRTNKLHYRTQYRQMLTDIGDVSTALLMDIRGASRARLRTVTNDPATLHEQFVIIRALLEQRSLADAVARVTGSPHRRWTTTTFEADPRRTVRSSTNLLRQIAVAQERIPIPPAHYLAKMLARYGATQPSLPIRFHSEQNTDNLDTPENRFVKFALEDFETFLLLIERRLTAGGGPADQRVAREAGGLRTVVSTWLGHPMFAEIGRLELLPFGSPVLQRRAGYRELLRAWTTFRLATSLTWQGGRDVFGGGKKDVALLYEYWVFFKLLDLVRDVFDLDSPPVRTLLESTGDGLDLKLKSGQHLSFLGRYIAGQRTLRVRFSYNRTFSSARSYPHSGAWTRPMRPDYTLSLWPEEFTETEAERQEFIVHVHFDAKYRVDDLADLFGRDPTDEGDPTEELDSEQSAFRTATNPKRADLLKMHTYRDAIRRSEGAYIIYPGSNPTRVHEWRAFTELLPGLGAFAVRPGAETTSLELLRTFLIDVADLAADDSRRLEQQTYHLFRIEEPSGDYRGRPELPPFDKTGNRLRTLPRPESTNN